ncbi:hypothetical protein Ancab_006975 [Ancistrocladus abbreviatus]
MRNTEIMSFERIQYIIPLQFDQGLTMVVKRDQYHQNAQLKPLSEQEIQIDEESNKIHNIMPLYINLLRINPSYVVNSRKPGKSIASRQFITVTTILSTGPKREEN